MLLSFACMYDRSVHNPTLFFFPTFLGSLCEASLSGSNFTNRNVEGRKQNPFSDQGQNTLTIVGFKEEYVG